MVEIMKRCGGCRRHVAMHESECPFCRTSVGLVGSAPALAVIVMSAMLFACGDTSDGDEAAESEAGSAADTTGTSDSSAGDATQGMSNTSAPTVTDASSSTLDSGVDSSTSEIDTDMTAGGFIYGVPDMGTLIVCDVFAQDCEKGEKCQPWANDGGDTWNAARCSPATGTNEVGDPCNVEGHPTSGIDDCVLGAICWITSPDSLSGVCVAQCGGSEGAPECDGDQACAIIEDGVAAVCASTCDDGSSVCSSQAECTPVGDASYCLPDAAGDG